MSVIPSRGSWGLRDSETSFNLAGVGSFRLVTVETGPDPSGDREQIFRRRKAQP
jgi:hypothetical protein